MSDPSQPEWPQGDPSVPPAGAAAARWFARLFGLVPLLFYTWTACRGTGWIDSAMHANTVFLLKTGSWVNVHNLFVYLGRWWTILVPIEDFAYSLNLLAGFLGAVTVTIVFRTGLLLTHNLLASTAGALALMVSHSLWWHSTILEVYTLNTALIAAMLGFVARWKATGQLGSLYAATLCFGLGVSNHVLMALFLFAFLALFLVPSERRTLWRPEVVGTGALAVLLGAQLWIAEFSQDWVQRLDEAGSWSAQTAAVKLETAQTTFWRATGGRFQESMFTEDLDPAARWSWRANWLGLIGANYPSVALPMLLLGVVTLLRDRRHRTWAVFWAVSLAAQSAWSSNYFIWDMFAFSLPVYVLLAYPVVFGFDRVWRWGGRARAATLVLLPTLAFAPALYAHLAELGRGPGYWNRYFGGMGASGLYEPSEFFGNPNKRHYTRTEDVIAGYARTLPEGAHLWDSDAKGYYPFRMYAQRVLGVRPDVRTHLVFAAFMDHDKAKGHAKEMLEVLERGEDVWVSSVTRPERTVLVQLYLLLSPNPPSQAELARMPNATLIETFPRYHLEKVPLVGVDDASIYHFVPR